MIKLFKIWIGWWVLKLLVVGAFLIWRFVL